MLIQELLGGIQPFGDNTELTRVDWVKNWVKSREVPHLNTQIDISSAWNNGIWTNNLGDGYITICIGPTSSTERFSFWGVDAENNTTSRRLISHLGSATNVSIGFYLPVRNNKSYKLVHANASSSYAAIGYNGTGINPQFAYFSPVES